MNETPNELAAELEAQAKGRHPTELVPIEAELLRAWADIIQTYREAEPMPPSPDEKDPPSIPEVIAYCDRMALELIIRDPGSHMGGLFIRLSYALERLRQLDPDYQMRRRLS